MALLSLCVKALQSRVSVLDLMAFIRILLISCIAGMLSKEALQNKIGGAAVHCHVKNKDLYGRSVSQCTSPGIGDVGHWLVQHGYAIAYR